MGQPVFAEGRVEHQKQNQTATSQWPVGFVFGVQLDYSCRLKSVPSNGINRVHGFPRQAGHFFTLPPSHFGLLVTRLEKPQNFACMRSTSRISRSD